MRVITTQEAAQQFEDVARLAHNGERILITRDVEPWALLSRFNEVEMLHVARRKTWLRGRTGQPLLSPAQFQTGLTLLQQDLAGGVVARLEIDYDEVFDTALELSHKYGQTLPIKTADLL